MRNELVQKSSKLFLQSWNEKGVVFENKSAGTLRYYDIHNSVVYKIVDNYSIYVSEMHYICCIMETKYQMSYLEFRNKMFDLGCFSSHQVYAWQPNFDRNNFVRWTQKGLLVRLRQGYYTFPEYKSKPDFTLYFANRIYRPSYVSLHTALAFYGMIPEAVVQITSVTTLKTADFNNDFGTFSYKNIKEELMFGYDLKPIADGRTLQLARPEKAILDLLYLYSFYTTETDLEELRLDEDFMQDNFNLKRMEEYVVQFKNKALEKRVKLLIKTYQL